VTQAQLCQHFGHTRQGLWKRKGLEEARDRQRADLQAQQASPGGLATSSTASTINPSTWLNHY